MKRLVQFLCLFLFVGPVLAAGRLADIEIYDRVSGRTLPVYESGGHWFVAGRPGNEYQVSIRNRDRGDLLAVISVDGVNVVTGETAAAAQSGYVIERGRTSSIAGWRKSLDRIAAFYFTDLGDSYAARTGRPDNVGVIGVALFRRKAPPMAELAQPTTARRVRPRHPRRRKKSVLGTAVARMLRRTTSNSSANRICRPKSSLSITIPTRTWWREG
jgi:hypothetical protein